MSIVNFRSGNMSYTVYRYTSTGEVASESRTLHTVQLFNPTDDEVSMEIIDATSGHNLGYFDAPVEHTYILTVLPTPLTVGGKFELDDVSYLKSIQLENADPSVDGFHNYMGLFRLVVEDTLNLGISMTFEHCTATANSGNTQINTKPVAEFTLKALQVINTSLTATGSTLGGAPTDVHVVHTTS